LNCLLGGWLTVTNLKYLVVYLHIAADAAPRVDYYPEVGQCHGTARRIRIEDMGVPED
jgi:hypothetical protein